MYGLFGGACSGTFHLAVRNSLLVMALSLTGFFQYVSASGLPGDQIGSEVILESAQKQIVADYPWLPAQLESLRSDFDKLNAEPSEDQVRLVLSILEPCTDAVVEDVLKDPTKRREAAWLLYLDTYMRLGRTQAEQLFNKHGPPRKTG